MHRTIEGSVKYGLHVLLSCCTRGTTASDQSAFHLANTCDGKFPGRFLHTQQAAAILHTSVLSNPANEDNGHTRGTSSSRSRSHKGQPVTSALVKLLHTPSGHTSGGGCHNQNGVITLSYTTVRLVVGAASLHCHGQLLQAAQIPYL